MGIENYIKELAPDQQEKASACDSVEELLALAKDAKVPVPDEALEAIAGGDDDEADNCMHPKCPQCGSMNVEPINVKTAYWHCNDCGYDWYL